MTKKFTKNELLIFLFLSAIFALALAYISQYIFGLQPCSLCLHQRKPFFAILIFCLIAFTFFKSEKSQKIILIFCTISLLINIGIAAYHVGVEQKIFHGPSGCSSNLNEIQNLEELKNALLATKPVRCDETQFLFLKLSMAAWNLIYCLTLLSVILLFMRKSKIKAKI